MSGILCSMVGATFSVAAAATVYRAKKGIIANGNAQIDTAQSKFGGASLYNDGSGDYVEVVNSNSFSLGTGNFTIELWWRATSRAGSYPPIITNFNDGYSADEWALFDRHNSYSTKFMFDCYNILNTGPILVSSTSVSNSTWYHLAIVRNGTTFTLYVNGTSEATYSSSASVDSGNYKNLFLGAVNGNYSNGHTDEIRISNTARYTSNFTPSTTPFVNDANTLLLMHCDGTDATTFFEDDNGTGRSQKGIIAEGTAAISTAQSKFGGSSLLTGSSNLQGVYVAGSDCTDIRDWTTYTGFTVECWVRYTSLSSPDDGGFPSLIGIMEKNDYTLTWSFGGDRNGAIGFHYYNGSYISIKSSNSQFVANTWYHFAAVKNGSTVKVYLDGVEKASATISGTPTLSTRPLSIGSYYRIGASAYVDEVRISKVARYTSGFTPSTTPFTNDSDTLFLMHADGTNSSTIVRDDNGGRASKGIQAIGNAQADTAQSKFGGTSLLLDGTGDYLQVGAYSDLNLGTTDFTYEFWYRQTASNTYGAFLSSGTASWASGAVVILGGSGTSSTTAVRLAANAAGGTIVYDQSGSAPSNGVWYHFALTRSGNTFTLYRDGVSVGTGTYSGSINWNDNSKTVIGGGNWDGASSYVNGWMDEIRLSNSVRYTAGFTPSTTPFQNDANTLLLLHMDGTDASTVFTDDNGIAPYTP